MRKHENDVPTILDGFVPRNGSPRVIYDKYAVSNNDQCSDEGLSDIVDEGEESKDIDVFNDT